MLFHVRNNNENAITKQENAMYGDFRSPILAHFQNVPIKLKHISVEEGSLFTGMSTYPTLFLSIIFGNSDRK